MVLEENLKNIIDKKFGNVKYFSEKIDLPYTTVRSILQRGILNAKVDNVIKIADGLDMKAEDLLDFNIKDSISSIYNQLEAPRKKIVYSCAEDQLREQNSKVIKLEDHMEEKKRRFHEQQYAVDIHGVLSAGYGSKNFDKDCPIKMVFLDRIPSHYDLAFEVRGNSMSPTFIDGEIVFIRKRQEIYSGMIGAVEINGEAFLKKLFEESHRLKLISLNDDVDSEGNRLYPDFYADEFDDIHLIGKVLN